MVNLVDTASPSHPLVSEAPLESAAAASPVRQPHGFEAGWDALVAVLTGAACLVLELEPLMAHSAHASEHHITTLMLSLRLMVSVRFRIAGTIAV